MEYDLSTQSVRSALTDLQLKVKLLEDERDHFQHMHGTTGRAFEDHRRELSMLLQKQRSLSAVAEDKLRMELQRVLAENTLLHTKVVESKQDSSARLRAAVEQFQETQRSREEEVRILATTVHKELLEVRSLVTSRREEKRRIEAELADSLAHQTHLQAELGSLKVQRIQLEEQQHADAEWHKRLGTSPSRPCKQDPAAARNGCSSRGRTRKTFIPGGGWDGKKPITHNMTAIVQTLERQAVLAPRPYDSTRTGRQLDQICRTVIEELIARKREYSLLTDRLADPFVDSLGVSRRMREVMLEIDRKTDQLRQLRRQQLRIDDGVRLHELFKDIASEMGVYESLHQELQEVIRSTSF